MRFVNKLNYLLSGFKITQEKLNTEYTLEKYIDQLLLSNKDKLGNIKVIYRVENANDVGVEFDIRYYYGELLDTYNSRYIKLRDSKVRRVIKCTNQYKNNIEDYELLIDYIVKVN